MIAAIRSQAPAGRPCLFKPPPPKPRPSERLIDHRVAEELDYLARQLELLGDILVNDPILLVRHSGPLQSLDLMKQALGQLAKVVAAEDKEMVADQISLTELKGRLQRKAIRPIANA